MLSVGPLLATAPWAAIGVAVAPAVNRLVLWLPARASVLDRDAQRRRALLFWAVTPLIFGLLAWHLGPTPPVAVAALYAALFLVIGAIDLEHRLIPNRILLPALLASPFTATLWGLSPANIALGGAIEFGFFLVSAVITRGGIAAGDVKLAAFLGFIAGYPRVALALLATTLVAGLASAALLALRIKSNRDYIPFAPFMLLGTAVALLLRC